MHGCSVDFMEVNIWHCGSPGGTAGTQKAPKSLRPGACLGPGLTEVQALNTVLPLLSRVGEELLGWGRGSGVLVQREPKKGKTGVQGRGGRLGGGEARPQKT